MPERNVMKIYQEFNSYYFVNMSIETAQALGLDPKKGHKIDILVQNIRNSNGDIITVVNKNYYFEIIHLKNLLGMQLYRCKINNDLIKEYGVRKGEYLDTLFNNIIIDDTIIPIFPLFLRYGIMDYSPNNEIIKEKIINKPLLEIDFNDHYYNDLIMEINLCYAYNLNRSTFILVRVVIENMLIDILRNKYGMENISLFFDVTKNKHHNLSILIDNFGDHIKDYSPYISSLDINFINKIKKLRYISNSHAHSLEIETEKKLLEENKDNIIDICRILLSLKKKLNNTKD